MLLASQHVALAVECTPTFPNIVLLQKRKLLTGLAADRYQCKGNGMAGAVFKNGERISHLPGFMGIGKRRATSGT